jgi:hypothetical protein
MTMNNESRVRLALIAGVYLWEASVLLLILSLCRMAGKPDVLSFLSSVGGKLSLMAALLFLYASLLVSRKYHALREIGSHPLQFIMKRNILPVILIIAIAEGTLRLFSTDTQLGTVVGGKLLGPSHFWKGALPRYPEHTNELYYYDQLLGWTLRPNLSSTDGMYFSSPEGMRSPRPGMVFADSRAACRIAIVGDSHTFGLELKFEDTWSYHLERNLPSGCQVLNFGVPGYSVGQMYLRYLRDVRSRHPNVVILALSSGAASRTMGVYGFNIFHDMTFSWAQPRFQITNQELRPINVPLPTPEDIVSARSIRDLPFLDYDWFFDPTQWDLTQWRYLYHSYLFRLYTTWYPLFWPIERRGDSEESLNHELLRSFIRIANSDGTPPVVVYLPDKGDYRERKETISLRILRTSGIQYLDLVPCLDAIGPNDRFINHGDHYSRLGGIAIAQCLHPVVVKKLSARDMN